MTTVKKLIQIIVNLSVGSLPSLSQRQRTENLGKWLIICLSLCSSYSMSALKEIKEHIPIIDEMRSLAAKRPLTSVLGKNFLIYPEVFHPDFVFDITQFWNREILEVVKAELAKKGEEESFDFLEVGCGAGYTSILVALASQKCRVWASDINETAVKNTIENAKMHGVEAQVNAVTADVYNHEIFSRKEFDLIYWNLPWAGQHTEPGIDLDPLMRSLLNPLYQGFRRYLLEAKSFLKKTGRIFVTFSFDIGSKELFDRMVSETGWSYKSIPKTALLWR